MNLPKIASPPAADTSSSILAPAMESLAHAIESPSSLGSSSSSYSPRKLMWWHDAIIDLMIAEPYLDKKGIAERLGCTAQAIYLITGSDLFKARLEQRRTAFATLVDQAIAGKLSQVAIKSLDLTLEVMEKKKDTLPLPLLIDVADKSLARLGYGVKGAPTPAVQVNVNASQNPTVVLPGVSKSELASARESLRSLERSRALESQSSSTSGSSLRDGGAEARAVEAEPESGESMPLTLEHEGDK